MQVPLSFQFTRRDSVSVPITNAFLKAWPWMPKVAMLSAYMKPEQAAERSNAPALLAPMQSCTRQAVAGKDVFGEEVETMIRSISLGLILATSNAFNAASVASEAEVS